MGAPIEFDIELVRRFDRNGPRYTSYPTADRFVEAYGEDAYRTWAARRNIGGIQRPLSVYVHLPFCRDVCFYCACNKIVTRDAGKASLYLDYLCREIELQAELFREDAHVTDALGWRDPYLLRYVRLDAALHAACGALHVHPARRVFD